MNTTFNSAVVALLAVLLAAPLQAQEATPDATQDKLSRALLLKLSRDQSSALCGAVPFTECMGFSKERCLELSEEALQQCLAPLPESINLNELRNESLEDCPNRVYEEAGYSEEKAKECLQVAIDTNF